MDERTFWRSTPRKLLALFDTHVKFNSSGNDGHNTKNDIDAIARW